jgi:hypothetical protein
MNRKKILRGALLGAGLGLPLGGLLIWAAPSPAQQPPPQQQQPRTEGSEPKGDLDSYIEVMRSDLRTKKMEIIQSNMHFTQQESSAFWPIYRDYEFELRKIFDEEVALIKDYSEHYENLTDEQAKTMLEKVMDIQSKRLAVNRKFVSKFNQALPPRVVARFFQLERRIDLMVDLKLASELPLVKSTGGTEAVPAGVPKKEGEK